MIEVQITAIHRETDEVRRFELRHVRGVPFPAFSPGAHIQTSVTYDGKTARNTYSLCGDICDTSRYTLAVRKQSQQGGSALWHRLPVSHRLLISAPHTNFTLSHRARHHLFIAGGIGITPFLSMMQSLYRSAPSTFELHYAAKSEEACAFYKELVGTYRDQVKFYFSTQSFVRHAHPLTPDVLHNRQIGTHVYLCGPTSLIEEFTQHALALGYPRSNIHHERFQVRQVFGATTFSVYLARQNVSVQVKSDESLLQALERHGQKIPYACRAGGCGTCQIRVLSGEVLHLDDFYSDEERNQLPCMLACVSRAKSSQLVLDL